MKISWRSIFGGGDAVSDTKDVEPKSFLEGSEGVLTGSTSVRSYSFSGEKTPGELGDPINLFPDYRALRFRAYEANLTNDVVKIITGKFFKWVVGTGLKISVEPNVDVLKAEGIEIDQTSFSNNLESYFSVFANSKNSDFSGMCNLHENAQKADKTAFLGGDCLIVCRLDDSYNISVQVIDGQHVFTPFLVGDYARQAKERGNIIKHGIEINKYGQHVAFYVATEKELGFAEYERIPAKTANGITLAWMYYGDKHRIDHVRGVSSLAAVLEKIKKLDRYTEASVSSAEERAKIAYAIEHSRFSDGENPLVGMVKSNTGSKTLESSYELGKPLEGRIAKTTNKQVFNMPIDSKLKALESNSEINYDTFFKAIFMQLAAGLDIPPEVAMQQYGSNYSASRAAINGWEYIVENYRQRPSEYFYKPIYQIFLYVHILKGKIKADGYLKAIGSNNFYITESLGNARFIGKKLPHIDPLKEVKALRSALGDSSKNETPLITNEQAAEALGFGDWWDNISKYKQEIKEVPQNANDNEIKE